MGAIALPLPMCVADAINRPSFSEIVATAEKYAIDKRLANLHARF
jgi:hypothetical protein